MSQTIAKTRVVRLRQTIQLVRRRRRVPVAMRLVLGLAFLIGVGTGMLLLPGMTRQPISFMDAWFTATSAAAITGLSVLTTSTDFTRLGQIVLLCLIQLGGVGYMVLVALTLQILGRRVSLLDRLAVSSSLGVIRTSSCVPLSASRMTLEAIRKPRLTRRS